MREQKDSVSNSAQSIDKTMGKQWTQTWELRNDHQKTEALSVKSTKDTKNMNISTSTQSSKPSFTQGTVNKMVGETCDVSGDFQKQTLLKQEMQYSNKDIKKKNVNTQPVWQTLPTDQDMSNLTEVKFSPKSHNKFKATDQKQTDIHLKNQDFLMRTNTSTDLKMAMEMSFNPTKFNPENNAKDSEFPLPPPSPPPPPPSNASSEIEFPPSSSTSFTDVA